MSSLPQFRLITLGRCAIERTDANGVSDPIFGTGKPLALIAYLSCAPHRSATREHLLDLLWADSNSDQARNSLRQLIWKVRHDLGETVLTTHGARIILSSAVHADRDDFLAAIARNDCSAALAAYGGSFLPDLAAPGSAEFEHWADVERRHLHSAYVRAAEGEARSLIESRRARRATEILEALRAREPEREATRRLLLEAFLADRNALAASNEAEKLVQMLLDEGREPEPATRRLLALATAVRPEIPDDARTSLVAELTGREAEFSLAMRSWREIRSGGLRRLGVVAEAGCGKTRLLQEIVARVRADGGRTVVLRGRAGERQVAWVVANDLVRELAALPGAAGVSGPAVGILVGLDPSLSPRYPGAQASGTDGPAEELIRYRAGAIRELLEAVAHEAPLLLGLDDVHWMDPSSRQVIEMALARLESASLLRIGTSRPLPTLPPLVADGPLVTLAPLTVDQVRELLASLGELPAEPWVTGFVASVTLATRGNPLLVIETARALLGRGLLHLVDGGWQTADSEALLQAARHPVGFAERVATLSARAREALEALALAPIPLPISSLARLLGTDETTATDALRVLELEGLAAERGDGWEVAHDRVRERVLALIPDAGRRPADLGRARRLLTDPELPPRTLAVLAPGCIGELSADETRRVFRRWSDWRRSGGDDRSDAHLVRDLLGPGADQRSVRRVLRALPWTRRFRAAPSAVAGLAAAGLLAFWGTALINARPDRLTILVPPLTVGGRGVGVQPAPVLEIEDRLGRRVAASVLPVSVRLIGIGANLGGATTRSADSGRVALTGVYYDGPATHSDTTTFEFSAPGVKAVRYTLVPEISVLALRLLGGTLGGQVIDPESPRITVTRGASVTGTIRFGYGTDWAAAAVMLGAVATWQPGPSGVVGQIPLPTPVRDGVGEITLRFRAPTTPGTYHLVLAYQAEPDAKWIASGTNWVWGHPVWGDGNDVQEWSDSLLDQARQSGRVTTTIIRRDSVHQEPQTVASRVVDVLVR